MPILRLSPDNTSYWISSGERLEVPSTDASAPTLANEVETTTGISIEEQAIHLSLLGVSKFSIESTGIITVAGTLNYETLVIADDHIPNKKYVDDAITAGAPHTHLEADITDLQAYASIAHTHLEADITDLQAYAPVAHTHLEADITDFAHTHVEADITDLQAYALAADVVKLTGDQTIAGTKTFSGPVIFPSYTVATLPTGIAGSMIFVTDDVGGATPAYYDGAAWRRVSDRTVVTT